MKTIIHIIIRTILIIVSFNTFSQERELIYADSLFYNENYTESKKIYDSIFVKPTKILGSFLWKSGDVKTIDRLGPDGISKIIKITYLHMNGTMCKKEFS